MKKVQRKNKKIITAIMVLLVTLIITIIANTNSAFETATITVNKIDGETKQALTNAKFQVYALDENRNATLAKGADGQYIGTLEQLAIGEKETYVVTSDELGKIQLNLPGGLYKLVEVEAPEGYELPEKEEDRTYYFGVENSKPEEIEYRLGWNKGINGTKWNEINSVSKTKDNGVIAVGSIYGEVDINNDGQADLTSEGGRDALIIKYSNKGEVEWAKNIGGSKRDEFTKVIQTTDGGYVAIGKITSSDINIDETIKTNGLEDGILVKFDSKGNYLWSKVIGGEIDDYIYSIIEDSNQNLIIIGGFYSTKLNIDTGITTTSLGKIDGYVASFTSNGTYNWHQRIGGTEDVQAVGVTEVGDKYIVAVNYLGTVNVNTNNTATSTSQGGKDGILITYNKSGNYIEKTAIGGTDNEKITGIITLSNGKYLVYGSYASTINEYGLKTKGLFDSMIIISGSDGNKVISYGGTQDDVITQVIETEDGGLLIGGYTYSTGIDINGDGTQDIAPTNVTGSNGYIIKLDKDYNLEYVDNIKGSSYDEVKAVAEITEGEYVIGGSTRSTDAIVSGKTGIISTQGYTDGFMVQYKKTIISAEIPEIQDITVENHKKQLKITTENKTLDDTGKTIGGTITGEYGTFDEKEYLEKDHIQYVEKVEYGKNSINEIVITPDENYMISTIKINDEDYTFEPDENGVVRIPAIENVSEDKHITVRFIKDTSSITVNHYIWTKENGTTTETLEGVETEHYTGKIGQDYTTSPKTDLEYVLITNAEYYGESIPEGLEEKETYIPTNAVGKYTEEDQTITYYYKEKTYKLTVHHYLEGTEEQVINKNGEKVQDQITEGYKKDEQYTTSKSEEIDYTKYELVEIPTGAEGKITEDTTVIYYYKLKEFQIITDVANDGGSISGEKEQPYEIVKYGENSIKDIIATPREGYYVEEITVNGEKINFVPNIDKTVTLDKFNNVMEDKEIIVKFARLSGTVITHYYIEGTKNKVILEDGTEAQDIVQTGLVGEKYTTKQLEGLPEYYEYATSSGETNGEYTEAPKTVIYYYKIRQYNYKVEYYYDNIKDEEATETKQAPYKEQIIEYTKKEKEGYKFERSENLPLTIEQNEENNVIKVYYAIRTNLKYKVEYYFNGELVEEEIEEGEATYNQVINDYIDKIREGYTLVKVKGIPLTIGVHEARNKIQVYYAKNVQAKVQYIDKTTDKIIEEIVEDGYIGKEFETEAKDYENYILVESPEEKTVVMGEDTILKYYYVHVSKGVIEKHIDIDTGEILDNTTYEGNEGDEYKTEQKEFKNYDFVEDRYPENAEGKMEKEAITVTYYYKKKEPIIIMVKYEDIETKEEIEEATIIKGYEGDRYTTEKKEIDGYEFVETDGEVEGEITENKEIKYYYRKLPEPDIPGEGGAGDGEEQEPEDTTTINKEIPEAGLMKQIIAIIIVSLMTITTIILVVISAKNYKK
ncbi:MAG: MucBP domain-containing protein [Clostridia bacterium]|nr:MucBP domain-containing protein [Clostridia bacterium]